MKKNKKIIISIVILIFLIFFSAFFLISQKKLLPPYSSPYVGGGRVGVLPVKTPPQINDISLKDNIPGEMSVYDFMNKLRSEGKINFTEKNYVGMGELIDSINGIKNNGNKYWIYYVNGVEAQIGVSNYKIKLGDIVSWKYGNTTQ